MSNHASFPCEYLLGFHKACAADHGTVGHGAASARRGSPAPARSAAVPSVASAARSRGPARGAACPCPAPARLPSPDLAPAPARPWRARPVRRPCSRRAPARRGPPAPATVPACSPWRGARPPRPWWRGPAPALARCGPCVVLPRSGAASARAAAVPLCSAAHAWLGPGLCATRS
jgi:hypothetical protein